MGRVIAVDGPSGAGKSSICKALAEKIGFSYLDTGAIYRAVALYLNNVGVGVNSGYTELYDAVKNVTVTFNGEKVFLNNNDVTNAIRTPEVGHLASVYSSLKAVRDSLLSVQRDIASTCNVVAEGRDMCTVVYPDAWCKFYLDASIQCRAERRFKQLVDKGINLTFEDALKDVHQRDIRDSGRDIAPLRCAEDAYYIDTTNLTFQEVLNLMLLHVQGRI